MSACAHRSHRRYSLGLVPGRLSSGLIIFIGLLVALVIAVPGFTPGQLVSVLGISSIAIESAFRDILQNILAGVLLLAELFRIGDQIVVDSFEGTVEDIQTRATFIKTYDGRRIVIPNSRLFIDPVTVNTAYPQRRLQYGIGYGDDIARFRRIMLDTARSLPEVLDDPVSDALVMELADSTVNMRLCWWVQPPRQADLLDARDTVLERVGQGSKRVDAAEEEPRHKERCQAWEEAGIIAALGNVYVQRVDDERLIQLAREHDLTLHLDRRPDDFVTQNSPMLRVLPPSRVVNEVERQLRRCFTVWARTAHRTRTPAIHCNSWWNWRRTRWQLWVSWLIRRSLCCCAFRASARCRK